MTWIPLTDKVLAQLEARGRASVDDIHPSLHQYTRAQLTRALSRLQQAGLAKCENSYRRGRTGAKGGSLPSTYWPTGAPKPKRVVEAVYLPMPISSVFQIAEPRELVEWPPAFDNAREFRPLGGWSLESDVYEERAA